MDSIPVFATAQDALLAPYTQTRRIVYIGGVITPVESYTTQHAVGKMATASLQLTLPYGEHIVPNAEVDIWDGHNNLVGRRFWGRLPAWRKNFGDRGDTITLNPVGWSSLLAWPDRFDLTFTGPISFRAVFDSLCARRGVPSYRADTVLNDDGSQEVMLADNEYIDDGLLTIPASQGPLSWLNNAAEPFGYRVYDDLLGTVRLSRYSGEPVEEPVVTFTESINIGEADQVYDISDIINYWDVQGPTYEDNIGRSVPIRAIPESVESDPLIPVNEGVSYQQYQSSLLTSQQLAEIVRRRLEIDTREPEEPIRWSSIAVPGVSPGDVVRLESSTFDLGRDFWLSSVNVSNGDDGLVATYEAWVGGGEPSPSGVDRITIPIQTAAVHLGDEYVAWYATPSPLAPVYVAGEAIYRKSWDFTIPKRATAVNVVFRVHGSNSQYIAGVNEDIEVSRFELWNLDETPNPDDEDARPHSSGNLPVLDEDYSRRYKYATDDSKWSDGAIALRGFDEEEVSVRLTLISGNNPDASAGPQDDFEVKNVYVEVYGTVEPVIVPAEE